ncbi:MAG: hypothetical protein WCC69_00245 [Pirellulales bacterium]
MPSSLPSHRIRNCLLASLLVPLVVMSGCIPRACVWWSPDGMIAAVAGVGADGLRLMRPDGTLSDPILAGEVAGASWLSDGSGLVIARKIGLPTWQEAAAVLPQDEVGVIDRIARAVPAVVRLAANPAVGDAIANESVRESDFNPAWIAGLAGLAGLVTPCVRDLHDDEFRAALRAAAGRGFGGEEDGDGKSSEQAFAEVWKEVQGMQVPVWELAFVPVANGAVGGQVRPLMRTLRPLSCPAVSPRGEWVAVRAVAHMRNHFSEAFLEGNEKPATFPTRAASAPHLLIALRLDGRSRIEVAKDVVSNPVWLSDGATLAFVTHAGGQGAAAMQVLERRTLTASSASDTSVSETARLALGLFPAGADGITLAALPGDRLLFPAVQAALPARPDATELLTRLFVVDASVGAASAPLAVPTPANALPDDLGSFSVSPDGKQAAVVESGSDAVAIVELKTGHVEPIAVARKGWKCGMLPAWRNEEELLIETLPADDAAQSAWGIWRRGDAIRWLGDSWSDEQRESLLRNRKDDR